MLKWDFFCDFHILCLDTLFFQFHVVCNYTFGSVFISAFFSDLPWRVEKKIDAWLTFGSFQTSSRLLRLLLDDLFFCLESWNPRFEMRLVRLFLFFKLLILYVKANSFHLRDLKATPTTLLRSTLEYLITVQNGKLSFIWLGKKDNLMLLIINSRLWY